MGMKLKVGVVIGGLMVAGMAEDVATGSMVLTRAVEARVGRPLSPASVAGVARRTTRRRIRRTAVYVAALPMGCTTVRIEGVMLHRCGPTYYQPYGNRFVVVNLD